MERVTCAFCGLPFRVRIAPPGTSHFCCSGCALASRIPVHGDRLPISRGLVLALVLGFGLFNQVLFAALAAATRGEGRQAEAEMFVLVANSIGGLLAMVCIGLMVTAAQRRSADWIVLAIGGTAGIAAIWQGWLAEPAQVGLLLLVLNITFALWLMRGWIRRGWRRHKLRR